MQNPLKLLYQTPKTVLNIKDLAIIWQETNRNKLKLRVAYFIKRGYLIRLARGIFAKDQNYNPRELATSIYAPSYISFETVLRDAGMIFQYYETIFVAGPWTRDVRIKENKFSFRKLKDDILFNPSGILNDGNTSIATPERAWLDSLYLTPRYAVDNLRPLNWEKCFELANIYDNKKLIQRVRAQYKKYGSGNF